MGEVRHWLGGEFGASWCRAAFDDNRQFWHLTVRDEIFFKSVSYVWMWVDKVERIHCFKRGKIVILCNLGAFPPHSACLVDLGAGIFFQTEFMSAEFVEWKNYRNG